MSTLHQDRGRAEADTDKGELRKPQDYSNQPGQGPAVEHPARAAEPADPDRADSGGAHVGVSPREYAHGSGDRNTRRGAGDERGFEGGVQRDAVPDAPLDPTRRPDAG
ncbi:MAG TPA: hypothetical protein VK827_01615 [Lysobacter sp.]|nr:hypothetical protein [Lysobacter sp.]